MHCKVLLMLVKLLWEPLEQVWNLCGGHQLEPQNFIIHLVWTSCLLFDTKKKKKSRS